MNTLLLNWGCNRLKIKTTHYNCELMNHILFSGFPREDHRITAEHEYYNRLEELAVKKYLPSLWLVFTFVSVMFTQGGGPKSIWSAMQRRKKFMKPWCSISPTRTRYLLIYSDMMSSDALSDGPCQQVWSGNVHSGNRGIWEELCGILANLDQGEIWLASLIIFYHVK